MPCNAHHGPLPISGFHVVRVELNEQVTSRVSAIRVVQARSKVEEVAMVPHVSTATLASVRQAGRPAKTNELRFQAAGMQAVHVGVFFLPAGANGTCLSPSSSEHEPTETKLCRRLPSSGSNYSTASFPPGRPLQLSNCHCHARQARDQMACLPAPNQHVTAT